MSFLISVQELHDTNFFFISTEIYSTLHERLLNRTKISVFCTGNNMGCLCTMCILSLSKKPANPPPQTTQLHTPQEQLTEYSMFYIKYTCLTRPLSCERPLKFSKDEDFLYSACLMPNWQSCPQVSEPQILLKLMWFGCTFPLAFKKVPPWIFSFLPSFWLYRKNGKMQTCEGLLSLGHSCKAPSSFRRGMLHIACARIMRFRRRNKDLSWQ